MTPGNILGILAEVADQPIEDWPALLANHFPDQPAMIQQGLLWLAAGHDRPEDEAAPPSLGKLGDERYELLLCLAAGATASVWRAHDRKLGRNVAIKVFRDTDSTSLELLEARAACDVISDHVVRVLDVHSGGIQPYIVMELVAEHDAQRGELALGAAASSCRPRSVEEAARWVMDVARGVHDAHLRNVFHRDLKPHNVLITPISRRARIADFGLALSAATDGRDRASMLVKRGAQGPVSIAGTPEYMAPEQARGLPIDLDPLQVEARKTLVGLDVWGLGALAYDLLSGQPPWPLGSSIEDDEPWEVAASGARPPPLRRTPRGERIPERLRRIVDKAMSGAPADRYTSAGYVAGELEAFLAHRPTSFDRSHIVRARLWSQRNPHLTVTGIVALALAAMTLATYASVDRLRDERRVLASEVAQQRTEEDGIKTRALQTRTELEKTKTQLGAESHELGALENSLQDEKKTYAALLAAKDKALHDASAATRELVNELTAARGETRAAEADRAVYKQASEISRGDADRFAKERDQAQSDRDAARGEREAMRKERDTASSERDQARAEIERQTRDLARLTAALAAANAKIDALGRTGQTGSASGSTNGPPVVPDARTASAPAPSKSTPAVSAGAPAARQRADDAAAPGVPDKPSAPPGAPMR